MTDSEKVDRYIEKHHRWKDQLLTLRSLFQSTRLKEEVKWGSPTYTLDGKLVAGMAAFKHHYALWFHQGVFLTDKHQKLINAQEGVTRALRQWKFTESDEIEQDIVLAYIKESIDNCLAGKEIKPRRKAKTVLIPELLRQAFDSNEKLKAAFYGLTPGRQWEYAAYIKTAKRESTRLSRLEKITPMILDGKGLNDKYKKS